MQGFLNRINKTVEYRWDEYQKRFPGFFYMENGQKNMPKIIAAQTMMNLPDFPVYARRYVDQDPTSYYFLMNASPLAGPCDRDTAVEFFYDLFHDKLHMPSSYERDEGLDPYDAADKEVLPAALDKNYKDFYTKQMEELAKAMGVMRDPEAEKKADDDEFEKKMGFRRDDPDIIDVTPVGEEPDNRREPGLEKAAKFGVAMPKKIWYGVDLHIPAGMELGYNGRQDLGNRPGARRLREADMDDMMEQAFNESGESKADLDDMMEQALDESGESKAELLDKLIAMTDKKSGLYGALVEIKDKYDLSECDKCGDDSCKAGEKCGLNEAVLSPDEEDDIADMFAEFSGQGTSNRDRLLARFMQDHAAELKNIVNGRATGLGDMNAIRDISVDDEQMNEGVEEEIAGILGEDGRSDTEVQLDEYAKVKDDVDEDDEILSESLIRRAAMLSREIW